MALADNKPRTVSAPRELQVQVTLAGTVLVGDLIAYDSGWKVAGAATATNVLVALEGGISGDIVSAAPIAVLSSFTGGTAGALLSTAANGAYQSGTGYTVGYFTSATEAIVVPGTLPVAP
jgi:hypothetical protein